MATLSRGQNKSAGLKTGHYKRKGKECSQQWCAARVDGERRE